MPLALAAILLSGILASAEEPAVLVLVRHAEKVDETQGSDLTPSGRNRARALAEMLRHAGIDAVYSTDYLRTRETAKPTAELIGKSIDIYDGDKLPAFASELRAKGGRALVVGHSDTTPELVASLGGDPGPDIAPDEYDRIYVLTLSADGKVSTLRLRFPSGVEE
jgi:broad specificity phosphatase PhoE